MSWRRPARAAAAALAAGLLTLNGPVVTPAAAAPAMPSGIGNLSVAWLAVSPAFDRTGLVVALAGTCAHHACLWVSRDGGDRWVRSAAAGWAGGRIFIGLSPSGAEILYAESSQTLQESLNDGATWVPAGPAGSPTPVPGHPGEVAVASGVTGTDYLLGPSGRHPVTGSGGSYADLSFAFAPGYPSAGGYPPALLAAANRSSGLPVIEQCTAALACHGSATLAGAQTFSAPGMQLFPAGDYASSGVVFARTGRGLYESRDGGSSFTPVPVGDPSATATATAMLALSPGFTSAGPVRTMYVALLQIFQDHADPSASHSGGGIYRSDNAGLSWSRVGSPSPLDEGATAVAIAPDGRLFAGYVNPTSGTAGLLCSTDQGNSWQATCPPVGAGASQANRGAGAGSAGCCTTTGPAASPGRRTGSAGRSALATSRPGRRAGKGSRLAGSITPSHNSFPTLPVTLALVVLLAAGTGLALLIRRRWRT